MQKLKVGILGATGMVGQRFASLLENHPWFEVACVAASPRSAGMMYGEAVKGRWAMKTAVPGNVSKLIVKKVEEDIAYVADEADFVFSALEMDKEQIRKIEEDYAARNVAVVSTNSAHRWTDDVPMLMPEINPEHARLIDIQRKNRGWDKGLISVKPNCSIQSYVPVIKALENFEPKRLIITTLQAISGAGKTFEAWPEMEDNVIPLINGEEDKSEKEPMKILGNLRGGKIVMAKKPEISATCIRVPVSDGHMASVDMELREKISKGQFINALNNFENPIAGLKLPSAPKRFIKYFEEDDRPQTKLDRDYERGMGLTVGRLREGGLGWKFVAISHNTLRGAAGGAILVAELLKAKGYLG